MIKGIYSAASAMIAGINRQQALAHDVANLDTPGFKQVLTSMEDFRQTAIVNADPNSPEIPIKYPGYLGLGVQSAPDSTDFSQGGLKPTSSLLDVAIDGNGFFRVKTPNGERYTRDGRFLRDSSSQLVTVDGYQVLDKSGQAIKLPEGDVLIGSDGAITANGAAVGQIGIAGFKDPKTELTRDGENTYSAAGAPTDPTNIGTVVQSYLEMSNADPTQVMTQLMQVARSYQAAQQMVSNQDELLGKTISTLGKID
jgi:flagellar basal-body rod protein FlgF